MIFKTYCRLRWGKDWQNVAPHDAWLGWIPLTIWLLFVIGVGIFLATVPGS